MTVIGVVLTEPPPLRDKYAYMAANVSMSLYSEGVHVTCRGNFQDKISHISWGRT